MMVISLSDHNPINLETCYKCEFVNKKCILDNKTDWYNATDDKIIKYKNLLDYKFQYYEIPQDILLCNNFECKEHNDRLLDLSELFIGKMFHCSEVTIGVKKQSNKRGIMNWNSFVQPYKDKSIFWHDVWKSAGCPANGHLADLRRFSRSKYHWAIRKVKYEERQYNIDKTADQLCNKSFNEFWKTIRKLSGSNKSTANVVDGCTSDDAISSRFKNIYDDLYNSLKDDDFLNIIDNVDNLVGNVCNKGMCKETHCHEVTSKNVKNAVFNLKPHKDDELYGICTENFINATDIVFDKLAQLITAMIKHGFSSELINTSFIKPIPKNNQKSLSDSNNYRAISKNTILSKIIDYIIIDKVGEKLKTSMYQFAYKENYSTSLCSFLVAETIQYYKITWIYCFHVIT